LRITVSTSTLFCIADINCAAYIAPRV
jgi:hypothetical protein